MITRFHVKNFKCLRDVTVSLSPFTVLIGKNDTGKTSLLQAIGALGAVVLDPVIARRLPVVDLITRGAKDPIEWQVGFSPIPACRIPGDSTYSLTMCEGAGVRFGEERFLSDTMKAIRSANPGRREFNQTLEDGGPGRNHSPDDDSPLLSRFSDHQLRQLYPRLGAFSRWLSSVRYFRLDPKMLEQPSGSRGEKPSPAGRDLSEDGYGLPEVLDHLLSMDRESFDQLEHSLLHAVPNALGIQLPYWTGSNNESGKEILISLRENLPAIPLREASDGIKYMLAVLALVHSRTPPAILLLEEPENGIHPHQLERIVTLLRSLGGERAGRMPTQVIVTTHSPYMLDFATPEEVCVFGRKPNGDSVVARLSELPMARRRMETGLSPGETWYNVGEDRLLQEVLDANAPRQ